MAEDVILQRFDRANAILGSRVNELNKLSSAKLSREMLPEMRTRAFFSAGVGSTRILEKLREVSDNYTAGKIDKASARWELMQWLDLEKEASPSDREIIAKLKKKARLDLILDQNKAIADAVAQYETDSDPDILAFFPFKRILPSTANKPRTSHKHLDNLILPADHPFWHTNTPPTDFNCTHRVELITEAEAREYGYTGRESVTATGERDAYGREMWTYTDSHGTRRDVPLSESGFQLNVAAPFRDFDASSVPPDLRDPLIDTTKIFAMQIGADPENVKTEDVSPSPETSLEDSVSSISPAIKKIAANVMNTIDDILIAPPELSEHPIPFKSAKLGVSVGGEFRRYASNHQPVSIRIDPRKEGAAFAMVHEIGHWFDNTFGRKNRTAYASHSAEFEEIMNAIRESACIKNISDSKFDNKSFKKYLMEPHECFARAFAQYVTIKSNNPLLVKEMEQQAIFRVNGMSCNTWSNSDFAPISRALDKFFASKGLLKTPKKTNQGGQ